MKKCIITVVGKDSVGIIAKSMYIPGRDQYQYFKYFPDNRGWVF